MDMVVRRCPLFDERLYTSPARALAIDAMHALHLGVVQRVVSATLHRIILSNPWDFHGRLPVVTDLAGRQLQTDLKVWQDIASVPHGERLGALTPKMIGSLRDRDLQES
eukprot:2880078-Pyramimonas_sp.AAC.1